MASSTWLSAIDAYCPPPDLGFIWIRESDRLWLASGMVSRRVWLDEDALELLLYRIMDDVIKKGDQLAYHIDFVAAEFTATFDGENGSNEIPSREPEAESQ